MERKLFKAKHKFVEVKKIIESQADKFGGEIIKKNLLIYTTALVPDTTITVKVILTLFGHKILEVKKHPRKLQPIIYGHRW